MNKILFGLILSIITSSAFAESTLKQYCDEYNGRVVKFYQCPRTKIPLPMATCVFENQRGEEQFFNGCSGPSGGHNNIFFKACIAHDLCYHHEPATSGRSQRSCDLEFLSSAKDSCELEARNPQRCKKWANRMYRALRIIGKPAFLCSNSINEY